MNSTDAIKVSTFTADFAATPIENTFLCARAGPHQIVVFHSKATHGLLFNLGTSKLVEHSLVLFATVSGYVVCWAASDHIAVAELEINDGGFAALVKGRVESYYHPEGALPKPVLAHWTAVHDEDRCIKTLVLFTAFNDGFISVFPVVHDTFLQKSRPSGIWSANPGLITALWRKLCTSNPATPQELTVTAMASLLDEQEGWLLYATRSGSIQLLRFTLKGSRTVTVQFRSALTKDIRGLSTLPSSRMECSSLALQEVAGGVLRAWGSLNTGTELSGFLFDFKAASFSQDTTLKRIKSSETPGLQLRFMSSSDKSSNAFVACAAPGGKSRAVSVYFGESKSTLTPGVVHRVERDCMEKVLPSWDYHAASWRKEMVSDSACGAFMSLFTQFASELSPQTPITPIAARPCRSGPMPRTLLVGCNERYLWWFSSYSCSSRGRFGKIRTSESRAPCLHLAQR